MNPREDLSPTRILRDRGLRALLAAEVVSTTWSMMTWLALPWFVLSTTGRRPAWGSSSPPSFAVGGLFGPYFASQRVVLAEILGDDEACVTGPRGRPLHRAQPASARLDAFDRRR